MLDGNGNNEKLFKILVERLRELIAKRDEKEAALWYFYDRLIATGVMAKQAGMEPESEGTR